MGSYLSRNIKEDIEMQDTNEYKKLLNWKRDEPDDRDYKYIYRPKQIPVVKETIDLRKSMPEIYDQGKLGSCTAQAIASCYEYDQIKEKEKNIFEPSRLFIYYNERKIEHTTDEDSGATIRDSVKALNRYGVIPEDLWPYDIENFTEKPSEECYEEGKKHKIVEYRRVEQELEDIKGCLKEGNVISFGFMVYESFMNQHTQETGFMRMPKDNEEILGGHAVVIVGYIDTIKRFIVRNSWTSEWGDGGYFYMPYDFALNPEYCSDFWTIQRVKDEE